MNLPSLYDHQSQLVADLRRSLAVHHNSILQAEPGVGKTRMSKWIMGSALANEPKATQTGNAVFCVHRRGLVDNASDSFSEEPALPHGLIMAGRDTDWAKRIQVGSIDTMISWYVGEGYESDHTFDLVVFDECHSHSSKLATWLEHHNAKRTELGLHKPYVIGLSATPEAKGLADIFGDIVTGPTTQWLIENNYLSPFRYFQATQGNIGALVKRGNEFTNDSVFNAMKGLSGDLVRDWRKYGDGRPTVGFFTRLAQAREAQEMLLEDGCIAEYVDGSTPDDERRLRFEQLGNGSIEYLCNVGIVERGTDIPKIGCVQLCTAVGSVVRYRQMIGRGSRTAPGKSDCIVIDHGGNVARHGFFEDSIDWILDNSKSAIAEHSAKPTIECPQCHRVYRGGKCSACDYEPTTAERAKSNLEFDGSELREIKPKDRKEPKQKTCEEIMISALYMAGRSGRTWKQALGIAYGLAQ
jgi:DNA repair protein RadD